MDIQYTVLIGSGLLGQLYVETKRTDITNTDPDGMHVVVVPKNEKGRGWGAKHSLAFFEHMIDAGTFVEGDHSTTSLRYVLLIRFSFHGL